MGLASEIERLSEREDGSDVVSGRMLIARGVIGRMRGDNTASLAWTRRAIECHRRTADLTRLLATMALHDNALLHSDDAPGARVAIAESLELAAGHPDQRWRQLFAGMLAFVAIAEGRFEEGEEGLQEILRHPERTDFAVYAARSYLADCAFGRGDGATALERYIASLETTAGDVLNSLIQIAGVAQACRCSGAKLRRRTSLPRSTASAVKSAC